MKIVGRAGVSPNAGTGSTLYISPVSRHVHSEGKFIFVRDSRWCLPNCRKVGAEAFRTLAASTVFSWSYGLQDPYTFSLPYSVKRVRLRKRKGIREGLHTSLTDLRLRKGYARFPRPLGNSLCTSPPLNASFHFWQRSRKS